MRLGRTESGGGSERRILRSALFVVGALALLSLPSIYFSTHVSRGADIADILHALSLDYHNNATTATTNNSETQSFGRQQEPDQARDGSVEQLQLRPAGAVSGVTPHDREKPLVAVVVCTKSSKDWLSVSQTSLHTLLIPSVEKTVTVHDLRKYRIEFVIGFDQGDEFWEQEDHRAELSGESLFPISFVSIPKDPNRPHKIPFNQLCRSAYEYGADYIVRVNDDSEFKTPDFISKSVSRLLKFDPPNVGVVGPTCKQGNTEILTHDFVHRTHLDIFKDYYPDEFDNWWIDDWISKVYGLKRTVKLRDWEVFHHTSKHGTRYKVDEKLKQHLATVVARGHESIETFLKTKTGEPGAQKVLGTPLLSAVWGPMAPFHEPALARR